MSPAKMRKRLAEALAVAEAAADAVATQLPTPPPRAELAEVELAALRAALAALGAELG